jgi:hypothetical protein
MPTPQTATGNCVAHNGSGFRYRDVMDLLSISGFVFDWTDPKRPKEIAFFVADR